MIVGARQSFIKLYKNQWVKPNIILNTRAKTMNMTSVAFKIIS